MKYILDVSGHDEDGNPGLKHFGGLFTTVEDAVSHGKNAIEKGRFWFHPEVVWVRDQEGETIRREEVKDAPRDAPQ